MGANQSREHRFMTITVLAHGSDLMTHIDPRLIGRINLLTPVRCGRTSWLNQHKINEIEQLAIDTISQKRHYDNDNFTDIAQSLKQHHGKKFLEQDISARRQSRDTRASAFPMTSVDDTFNIEQPVLDHKLSFTTAGQGSEQVMPHVHCIDASNDIISIVEGQGSARPFWIPLKVEIGTNMLLSKLSQTLINEWKLDYINIIDLSCRVMENRHDVGLREERTRRGKQNVSFNVGDNIKVMGDLYTIVDINEKGITVRLTPTLTALIQPEDVDMSDGGGQYKKKKKNYKKITRKKKIYK